MNRPISCKESKENLECVPKQMPNRLRGYHHHPQPKSKDQTRPDQNTSPRVSTSSRPTPTNYQPDPENLQTPPPITGELREVVSEEESNPQQPCRTMPIQTSMDYQTEYVVSRRPRDEGILCSMQYVQSETHHIDKPCRARPNQTRPEQDHAVPSPFLPKQDSSQAQRSVGR
jgi:hypothetical protein